MTQVSNVISLCDYKQKKIEEKIEKELNAITDQWFFSDLDDMFENASCTTTTFTVTVDDEVVTVTVDDEVVFTVTTDNDDGGVDE